MNKRNFFVLPTLTIAALLAFGNLAAVCAQETAASEFTLEEITVTAEKRAVNVQALPSSVVAIEASALEEQGKTTTAQILETVPNLTYRAGSGTNPDGNITIRGVQRTQESGGTNAILPSVTAIYTDGVYQGIGGNYDINRVEVLRGPQGTLYGRSATGGVVSFYTNDPKLEKFGVDASAEYGTASLINVQAAVNAPVGSKVALRAAGHYYSKDGYFDADGGKTSTKEGRIKALFQPTDAFSVVLGVSAAQTKSNGGGFQPLLVIGQPDKINYKALQTVISKGAPNKYRQVSVNANYDFGDSTLTYVGGYHDYDSTGLGAESGKGENLHRDLTKWPKDYYHSEEIRWASSTKGQLTWLVGANYFKHRFDTSLFSVQTHWSADPALPAGSAEGLNAPIFGQIADGSILNYGLFTEETYKVQDNFRITAGLRLDKTKLDQAEFFQQNTNTTPPISGGGGGNSLNPATFASMSLRDIENFNNVTYKLRFEYDLTKDNMLYLLTATGFMPGYATISPTTTADFSVNPPVFTHGFQVLKLDQQKLTSYEMGSKNQFLKNTLRLNGDVFYYDYGGYVEAENTAAAGPPVFTPMAVPLKMYGVEVDGEYLITMNDKVSWNAGFQSIKITDRPIISGFDVKNFMALTQLPGNPRMTATLDYEHSFIFEDGSSLAPRFEVRYTGAYYLSQMTNIEVTPFGQVVPGTNTTPPTLGLGEKAYNHQEAYALVNLGITWNSSDSKYSASAYARNVFDTEYKAGVGLNTAALSSISVTPGDPRTFGVTLRVKF
jgi:outer membrane receptor protein involved in Fe transport